MTNIRAVLSQAFHQIAREFEQKINYDKIRCNLSNHKTEVFHEIYPEEFRAEIYPHERVF
jgi:hypothetical protein